MSTIQYGIHRDVPFEEYQSWEAVSKHQLDLIARSPKHYMTAKENPPETTPAMHFGTAAHAWILEPETAPNHVAVAPRADRRTKAGKEAWAEFEMMHAGKTLVSEQDARDIARMAAAVQDHPIASKLLREASHIECSALHAHAMGVDVRCRPDMISGNVIVDLKTAVDASQAHFASSMHKYRYHVQAAFYLDIMQALDIVDLNAQFVFMVVEKKPPYGVAMYAVQPEDIDRGRLQYERDMRRYKYGLETGQWPGYTETIGYVPLPFYARKEIDTLTGNE